MKVMGIHAGRKNGNSSVLIKEALIACQEMGAEVRLINLHDYKIQPCSGCGICMRSMVDGKRPTCMYDDKDDMKKIMDIFLQQDGFIIGVPTYDLMPSGIYINFANRFLPYEAIFLKKIGVIDRIKERAAGIIATGGSTRSWMSMVLEGINATMFMQSIKVVDQFLAVQCNLPGQAALYPYYLARARRVGENVMKTIGMPEDQRKWLGEDEGWCPVCHSNSLSLGEPHWDGVQFPIECQVCGAGGDLERGPEGQWKFVPAPDGLAKCRINNDGRENHFYEIQKGNQFGRENMELILQKMEKYKKMYFPSI